MSVDVIAGGIFLAVLGAQVFYEVFRPRSPRRSESAPRQGDIPTQKELT